MFVRLSILFVLGFALLTSPLIAYELGTDLGPERRKNQFDSNSGYLVFPTPYNLPGIGSGMMLVGSAGNIMETNIDAYIVMFQGDAAGYFSKISEIFLIPENLYFTHQRGLITSFGLNAYSKRGMDTKKDDYNIMVGDHYAMDYNMLTASFWERRLEISIASQTSDGRIRKILTPKEELVFEYTNPQVIKGSMRVNQVQLDLTDDFNDPRAGFRAGVITYDNPANNAESPEFVVTDLYASYFVPIWEQSSWVFHYYSSGASVSKKGLTDVETLKARNNFSSCQYSPDQAACEAAINEDIQNTISANSNGTANALGGPNRLRSYPNGRYSGAYTRMYGTEFRWNISTDKSAIDWYVLQDVQEALQLAFFHEQGTVAETQSALGDITRSSTGLGVRLVTGSGSVYRFDVAAGQEGSEVTLLFNYPWLPGGF